MGNEFDAEMDRIAPGCRQNRAGARAADSARQLDMLKREVEASEGAGVDCRVDGDTLAVSVKGQPIGAWRVEGANLVLYRPGSSSAEGQATSPSQAASMTARLVAAAGQA